MILTNCIKYLYLALVKSVISYGIVGWDGAFDNVLRITSLPKSNF